MSEEKLSVSVAESEDLRYQAANYRVRVFLSVDLSGSTDFKNSKAGNDWKDGAPNWVQTFHQFYSDFPDFFRTNFVNLRSNAVGDDTCPALWKAVGDELVFCGRVTSVKSTVTALQAFIEALQEYRKRLQDKGVAVDLKGAAWLAAFPEPNRAVQLRRIGETSSSNVEDQLISASEALEAAADERPYDYDFLGKAIDTGFRIAATAKPERFILSVQLARLLVASSKGLGFDRDIRFDAPQQLKGVNGGEPYPVLYLDSMDHLEVEATRKSERKLLGKHLPASTDELKEYLENYCRLVRTDEIKLRRGSSDSIADAPDGFAVHHARIHKHLQAERDREFSLSSSEVEYPDSTEASEFSGLEIAEDSLSLAAGR